MKVNEKSVEIMLESIKKDLESAYRTGFTDWKNLNIRECLGKVETLLTIIDFE